MTNIDPGHAGQAMAANMNSGISGTGGAGGKKVPNGKKVNLQLTYELNGKYKVSSVTNTIAVHPGQSLEPEWVRMVCDEYDNWEVTMVNNDVAAQVFGFIRGMIPVPAL